MTPVLRILLRTLLLVGVAGARLARGAEAVPTPRPEVGNPFIRNYSPKEYGADAQNWSVVQDGRGVIHLANNQGVLEYDGARWRLLRTPNKTVVRSLAVDGMGRVYVGASGELGYLGTDEQGQERFVSMATQLPEDRRKFTDVWVTAATPRGILFQSREYLFLFSKGSVQTWKATTTFHVAFVVGGRIFVRQRNVGLMELMDDRLALLPGGERFANESVFTMLPLGEGDAPLPILIGSRKQGLWRYDGRSITPFPSGADAFLKDNALYHGARLPDGTLALATITGGVAILDREGSLLAVLDRASGLQGDNVKFLYPDRQGSLWMGLDNGISKVEWPSPLSVLDERLGLKGTVWAVQRHQGSLYVATGQGAFRLEPASAASAFRPAFHPLEGLKIQCLAFLSMEDHLLLATSQGVAEVQGGKAAPVRPSSAAAISLWRSRVDPERVFVGLQGSLASIRLKPGPKPAWVDEGAIPGVSDDIYSMAEDAQGHLWLGLGVQGLIRVTFPSGWKGGASPAPRVERFGPEHGLPDSIQTYVVPLAGGLVFTTHQGIYRFDDLAGRLVEDPRFAQLLPANMRWVKAMSVDGRGRIWLDAIDEGRGIHESREAVPQPDGTYRWEPNVLKRLSDSAIEVSYPDRDGIVWFGGPGGLFRFDPTIGRSPEAAFPALIRRVSSRSGKALPAEPGARPVALKHVENALRFEFAAPSYDLESANLYQMRLEGYDRDWSPWTAEAQKEYTNLHEGSYRFRVRSQNAYGRVGSEATFGFRILPPWYRVWWAYLLYLVLGALAILQGFRIRTRRLRERNIQLHARIAEATMELFEHEQELERVNQDLKALNEQKNQYLGMVAHDLRNPLHGILLTSDMIEQADDVEEARRMARQLSRAAMDMSLLIDRFLDIAAIDAGTIKAEPASFSLSDMAGEVIEAHGARARAKGITLRLESGEAPVQAFADPKFMKGVMENLLSNAIKFSPQGREVIVRVGRSGEKARLSVIDQGPGLSEEDKGKLFGRFTRLSARPTAGEGTVGLGLSIVKHLVDAMGGRIWVESVQGQGAAFHVELPGGPA